MMSLSSYATGSFSEDDKFSSEDEGRRRPARCRGGGVDFDLQQLCVFMGITGASCDILKNYERHDGSPVVPGVCWDDENTPERQKLWHVFRKCHLRNARKSIQRRRKYPQTDSRHAHSLPIDYSPFVFIKVSSSVLRSRRPYQELPLWTKSHFQSQFAALPQTSMVNIADVCLKKLCQSYIGEARIKALDTEVCGEKVDYHVEATMDNAGLLAATIGPIQFHARRSPRSNVQGDQTFDTIGVSVLSGDTSRPSKHLTSPPQFGEDRKTIFFSVATSKETEVQYAEEMLRQGEGTDSQATQLSKQIFATKLSQVNDVTHKYCVEFPGVSLIPRVLQNDPELLQYLPNGIVSKHVVLTGDIEDGELESPSAILGYDFIVAIEGRSDDLKTKRDVNDFLAERVHMMSLSGDGQESKHRSNTKKSSTRRNGLSSGAATAAVSSSNNTAAASSRRKNRSSTGMPTPATAPPVKGPSAKPPSSASTTANSFISKANQKNATPASAPPTAHIARSYSSAATTAISAPNTSGKKKKNTPSPAPIPAPPSSAATTVNTSTSHAATVKTRSSTATTTTTPLSKNSGKKKQVLSSTKKLSTVVRATLPKLPPRQSGLNMKLLGILHVGNDRFEMREADNQGDCLVNSLNGSNDYELMKQTRQSAYTHLCSFRHVYNLQGVADEAGQIRTPGSWCGETLLQVYADMSGNNINVIEDGADERYIRRIQPSTPFQANATGEEIYLLYSNNSHYDLLRPIIDIDSIDDTGVVNDGEGDCVIDTISENESDVTAVEDGSDDDESESSNDSMTDAIGGEGNKNEGDVLVVVDDEDGDDEDGDDEDGDDNNDSEDKAVGSDFPSIEDITSGSFDYPTPVTRVEEEQPRGSPLERFFQSGIHAAQSAVSAVMGGFNASPSGGASLPRQDLNQRFGEHLNRNHRRSGRARNQRELFDPSA